MEVVQNIEYREHMEAEASVRALIDAVDHQATTATTTSYHTRTVACHVCSNSGLTLGSLWQIGELHNADNLESDLALRVSREKEKELEIAKCATTTAAAAAAAAATRTSGELGAAYPKMTDVAVQVQGLARGGEEGARRLPRAAA